MKITFEKVFYVFINYIIETFRRLSSRVNDRKQSAVSDKIRRKLIGPQHASATQQQDKTVNTRKPRRSFQSFLRVTSQLYLQKEEGIPRKNVHLANLRKLATVFRTIFSAQIEHIGINENSLFTSRYIQIIRQKHRQGISGNIANFKMFHDINDFQLELFPMRNKSLVGIT